MTKEQFIGKAVRNEESRLSLPRGWWGTWRDIYGPEGVRVRFSRDAWVLSRNGRRLGRYEGRRYAIAKARRLQP